MMIITSLIVLALVILVHEWGHFIAARNVGIEVEEFSIGFGPKLFSVNRKTDQPSAKPKTEYSLRLFPFGGFVRMAGVEPDDENPSGFNRASPWDRIKVLGAGPLMNFVLAVVLFIFAFTLIGIPEPINEAVLGEIIADKPAAHAGLKPGDRVVKIDGQAIVNWEQMVEVVQKTPPGNSLEMVVNRDDHLITVSVQPEYNESTKTSILGVTATLHFNKLGLWEGIKVGFINTYLTTVMMLWCNCLQVRYLLKL